MNIVCVESLGISREHFETLREHYAAMGHEFTYYMDRQEDEETLAQRMKDLGCTEALNLDGGGSTCLLVDGKSTVQESDGSQRPVGSTIMLKKK